MASVLDAFVRFLADTKDIDKALGPGGAVQQTATQGAQSTGQKVGSLIGNGAAKAFTAAGAIGGVLFTGAIGGAVNFEDQLRTINTVAHLTDSELAGVGNSILGLSKETGKSTDDLTAGFYDLVSAGIPAKDAINVLRDSAKFATGALGTTGEAVDVVTSALNAYGMEANQSTKVTDIFAQAVADGKVTAAELGQSIATIAPIASSAGVSLQEVSAGFAVLTAKGVPATQAATQMRAAISALLTPNTQLNALQAQTGINFAALAKEKGLAVALDAIRVATNGDNDAFAKSLGSIEAYQFALASTGDESSNFATELGKVEQAAQTGGVAQGQYTEQMKSAKKQGEIWVANLRAIAITIGGPFTAVLGPAVSAIGSMGQGMIGLAAVGGSVGGVLGKLASSKGLPLLSRGLLFAKVSALTTIPALFATGGALNFMLGPIGIIVVAVGALFVAWQTNFLGIRDIVGHVVDFVGKYLGFLLGPIKVVADAVGGLFKFIGEVAHNVGQAIGAGGDEAVVAADQVIGKVDDTIAAGGDRWRNEAALAAAQIPTGIDSAGKATYDAAAGVAGQVPDAISATGPAVRDAASKAMLEFAGGLRKKRSDIDAAMTQLTDDIKNKATEAKERVHLIGLLTGQKLADALHSKDPVVKAQAEGTKQLILERLDELGPGTGKAGKAAQAALAKAMHDKDPDVREQARLTKQHVEDQLNSIKATAAGEKAAKALATSIAAWIKGPGRAILGGAVNFIEHIFSGVTGGGGSGGGGRSFAVGTTRVPYDMYAMIHQGEIIVPADDSEAIRRGRATLGRPSATSTTGGNVYNITANVQGLMRARTGLELADNLRRYAENGVLEPVAVAR